MKYQIHLTPQACGHIYAITTYLKKDLRAPQAAARWLDRLQSRLQKLDEFPERIPLAAENPWHSLGLSKDGILKLSRLFED